MSHLESKNSQAAPFFFNLFDHDRQLDTEIKSNLKPNLNYLINESEKAIVHFFHKVQAVHLSDNSIIFDPLSLPAYCLLLLFLSENFGISITGN